jgi:CxxC motif-containing protein
VEEREFICVTCPVGCTIRATVEGSALVAVRGQACRRGIAFVQEELTAPTRALTTTVRVDGGTLPLVPVRSAEPLPKGMVRDVAARLRTVRLSAPVAAQQVVLENALGSGVTIVTTRAVPRAKEAC